MKKLFIHIPKNGGMTIRDSKIFQDKIEPVNKKWIQDFHENFRALEKIKPWLAPKPKMVPAGKCHFGTTTSTNRRFGRFALVRKFAR